MKDSKVKSPKLIVHEPWHDTLLYKHVLAGNRHPGKLADIFQVTVQKIQALLKSPQFIAKEQEIVKDFKKNFVEESKDAWARMTAAKADLADKALEVAKGEVKMSQVQASMLRWCLEKFPEFNAKSVTNNNTLVYVPTPEEKEKDIEIIDKMANLKKILASGNEFILAEDQLANRPNEVIEVKAIESDRPEIHAVDTGRSGGTPS